MSEIARTQGRSVPLFAVGATLLLLAAARGIAARPHMPKATAQRITRRSTRLSGTAPPEPPQPSPKRAPPAAKKASTKKAKPSPKKAAAAPAAAAKAPASPSAPADHASREREEAAWADGIHVVVGCDEAGRGPLAGPVVAAACMLPASAAPIPGVGDSKAITDEAMREALYEQIVATPGVLWSARVIGADRIDEINILMASLEAMRLSTVDVLLAAKSPKQALALVDGPFSPWKEGEKYVDFQTPAPPAGVDLAVEPIKKGDAKVYCIAAASIIAKVTRDRCMHAYDREWPMYAFAQHKGYPVPAHVAAIAKHGPCAIHRRTFAPLKTANLEAPTAAELKRVEAIDCSAPYVGE